MTTDVGSDPTVGLPDFCTLCGQAISCSYCGDGSGDAKDQSANKQNNNASQKSTFESFSDWAADEGDEEDELGERKSS